MGKLNTLQARHEGYIAGLHGAPSTPPMTSEDVRRAYEAGYDLGRERRTPPASQSEALVTQADWDAAERYFSEANPADVFHGTELAQAFAQHRIEALQAREAAAKADAERLVEAVYSAISDLEVGAKWDAQDTLRAAWEKHRG